MKIFEFTFRVHTGRITQTVFTDAWFWTGKTSKEAWADLTAQYQRDHPTWQIYLLKEREVVSLSTPPGREAEGRTRCGTLLRFAERLAA